MRTTREKWILAILPAVLTVVIYVWTYGRELQVSVNRLIQQTRAAEAARPSRETIATAQATLQHLRADAATRTLPVVEVPPTAPALQFAPPTTGLQTITHILSRNHILVVSTQTANKSAGVSWPGEASDLSKRIAERRNGTAPVLWSVDMIGSYEQIRQALEEIAASDLCVIPQDITMETLAPDAAARHWTLWIWL
jgi:hypothetical protein